MKKLLVSILVFALLATVSLTAFAATPYSSPIGVGEWKVEGWTEASGTSKPMTPENYTNNGNGTITFKRSTVSNDDYIFVGWVIVGDYEIVDGTLTSDTITIRPKGNITVTEHYKEKVVETTKPCPTCPSWPSWPTCPSCPTTKPAESTTKPAIGPEDNGPTAPDTGGSNLPALAVVALLAMSVAIVTKKHFEA